MIPNAYKIAMVGLDPQGVQCIWAIVDPERSAAEETIRIVGTGNPIPPNVRQHIGSFIDGPFVWHVFIG